MSTQESSRSQGCGSHTCAIFEIAKGTGNNIIGCVSGGLGALPGASKVGGYFTRDDRIVKKVIGFIKEHWKVIAATALAWAVIIGIAGGLYGFQNVALKLVIGGGVGAGFGIGVGLIRGLVIRPPRKYKNYTSAWGALNTLYQKLDENGTRQFLIALVTTAMLAVAVIYPYAAGGIIAAIIFDHLINEIAHYNPLEDINTRIESWNQKRVALQAQVVAFKNLEDENIGEQYKGNKIDLAKQVQALKEELDAIAQDLNKQAKPPLTASKLQNLINADFDPDNCEDLTFDRVAKYLGLVYERYQEVAGKLRGAQNERESKKHITSATEQNSLVRSNDADTEM